MYFSQIPHNFGRRRPQPILSEDQLRREIELLDSLSDMKIAEDIIKEAKSKSGNDGDTHPLDHQYAGLGLSEMTPLDRKSAEFGELEAYLQGTRGQTHTLTYEVEDIFRIERSGEYVVPTSILTFQFRIADASSGNESMLKSRIEASLISTHP
jgi:poly [ADP-ribose] polymerase